MTAAVLRGAIMGDSGLSICKRHRQREGSPCKEQDGHSRVLVVLTSRDRARSAVVKGWSGCELDAAKARQRKLEILPRLRLGHHTLDPIVGKAERGTISASPALEPPRT